MERKTPLYDRHTAAGGKLVPFAGWLLPVQYSGVIAEHRAVRTGCGLFDVSHMGELLLRGPDALANLNRLMTNDFSGMADGQARYSPMCYEDGGVVDDLIVYRCSDTAWLAVVNASNTGKDRDWMAAHLSGDCTLEDLSDQTAQLALQGPGAEALLRTLAAKDLRRTTPPCSTARWTAGPAWSPAPGTPARTALSSTAPRRTPPPFGTR